jgi:Secretion system C-terminal sorting domain
MKKLYTLALFLLAATASFAQTFYSENFGTPDGTNPAASSYTGYQNSSVTYTGTASARVTAVSTGYTGASGSGNIYFGADQVFEVSGINTAAYSTANLSLTFGQLQSGAADTAASFTIEKSTDGTNYTPLAYTRTATSGWELITIGGSTIPSTTNLRLRFTRTAASGIVQYRIDDLKLSNVSANCTFAFGSAVTTACDNATLGTTDTFTATIPFTGAANGTFNITSTAGTIGGDNPTSVADGNIVISGVTENTNFTVTVISADCNTSLDVVGVYCKPVNTLPYYEGFNYTTGTAISETQKWWGANSGDGAIVAEGNLSYTGLPAATGKSVTFSGAGQESYTQFTTVTTGTVYSSFLVNVTDLTNVTVDGASTYTFGYLEAGSNSFYIGRIFLKKAGEQYQIGLGVTSDATAATFTTTSYNVNDTVFLVLGYDFTNATASVWVNPTIASLTASTPATLTATFTTPAENVGGFMIRQDGAATTPTITFDELRIGTTLAAVTTTTAGVAQNNIDGLTMFPNPLTGNTLNITSNSNGVKSVAIFDMLGKQVTNTTTVNNTVDVANLTAGIYMVKITEEGKTATRKLVKQ